MRRSLSNFACNFNLRRYPEVLMYGMMCVLLAVGIWQGLTLLHFSAQPETTHSSTLLNTP
jgi:hypothetical protein